MCICLKCCVYQEGPSRCIHLTRALFDQKLVVRRGAFKTVSSEGGGLLKCVRCEGGVRVV